VDSIEEEVVVVRVVVLVDEHLLELPYGQFLLEQLQLIILLLLVVAVVVWVVVEQVVF
jgi:hypothetical protein